MYKRILTLQVPIQNDVVLFLKTYMEMKLVHTHTHHQPIRTPLIKKPPNRIHKYDILLIRIIRNLCSTHLREASVLWNCTTT